MRYVITQEPVWVAEFEDVVGGLTTKLEELCTAGINLEFMICRRSQDKAGNAVMFLVPAPGDDMSTAAPAAGLQEWKTASSLRIEGPDRPQLVLRITATIRDAGIDVRGVSGATIAQRAVFQIAFDSSEDANLAAQKLENVLNSG